MRKGIYLNVLLRCDGDPQPRLDAIRQAVDAAARGGTPHAHLTGEVKRIRLASAGDSAAPLVDVLVYLTGEQDAPQSFFALATAELRQLLETLPGPPLRLHAITENTSAVDELADETGE